MFGGVLLKAALNSFLMIVKYNVFLFIVIDVCHPLLIIILGLWQQLIYLFVISAAQFDSPQ